MIIICFFIPSGVSIAYPTIFDISYIGIVYATFKTRNIRIIRITKLFITSPGILIWFISVFNQLDAQNLFHNKFYFMPLHVSSTILCIKLVKYWNKYTEMHDQQNVKIWFYVDISHIISGLGSSGKNNA